MSASREHVAEVAGRAEKPDVTRRPAPLRAAPPRRGLIRLGLAGLSIGALIALLAIDVTTTPGPDDKRYFINHPVVVATLIGVVLIFVTVLVAEAMVEHSRAKAWRRSTRVASKGILLVARRTIYDTANALSGGDAAATGNLSGPNTADSHQAATCADRGHEMLLSYVTLTLSAATPASQEDLATAAVEVLDRAQCLARTLELYAHERQRNIRAQSVNEQEVRADLGGLAASVVAFDSARQGAGWNGNLDDATRLRELAEYARPTRLAN
jgi:hypothetical protein